MTLLDLCRLLRRYLALVIALPVACVLACAGYFMVGSSSSAAGGATATARIIVNSQVAPVAGIAQSEARQAALDNPGLKASAKVDSGTMTVTITADGGEDAFRSAAIANDIAESTVAIANDFYANTQNNENLLEFKAQVELADPNAQATAAEGGKGLGGKAKYLLVALLGGLFLALCILVVIDAVRRPVKSIEGVQDAVELPVLESLPVQDGGARLLANVRFASKQDNLTNVTIIPAGSEAAADDASAALAKAARAEGIDVRQVTAVDGGGAPAGPADPADAHGGLTVIRGQSLGENMGAAYVARNADAVVVTVAQWADSLKDLEAAVAELKLADAKLVGIVFRKK